MKPLTLTLSAFGSYPGTEVIDFTALSGLGIYVVTGPTGSGKTTVFDAMAYALYGKVPGVREAGDIRSHHADSTVPTSVTFRFEVDGEVYRVERSPEQVRPGKRKGAEFVKKAANAVLVRESDGATLALKAAAAAEVCAELIGLSADQFERVVLLPQGRFQQFLLANTKERQPLLRQLFDTGRWETVTDRLKARAVAAKAEVATIEEQLGHYRHSLVGHLRKAAEYLNHDVPLILDDEAAAAASLDSLDELRAQLDNANASRREAARHAADASRAATELEANAERRVSDWTARQELRATAVVLDAQVPAIAVRRARLAAATSAQPVVAAIARHTEVAKSAAGAGQNLETTRGLVVDACGSAGVMAHESLESLITAIAEARNELTSERLALGAVVDASSRLQEHSSKLAIAVGERAAIAERLGEIDADLDLRSARLGELEPLAQQCSVRQLALTAASDRGAQATRFANLVEEKERASTALVAARETQKDLLDRFIADAAPRLAAELVAEQPCPVCGGTEHPAPATVESGEAVNAAEVDLANTAISEAVASFEGLDAEQRILQAALGDEAGLSVEHFEQLVSEAQGALDEAEAAAVERDALATAIEAIRADRVGLEGRAATLDVDIAGLEVNKSVAATALDTARDALGDLAERFDSEGEALVSVFESRERELNKLEERTTEWSAALTKHEGCLGELRGAEELITDALLTSGFVDLAAAQAAVVDPVERDSLETEVATHDSARANVEARLPALEALDLPVECPEISDLRTDAATKLATATALADDVSRIDERLGENDSSGARGDLVSARTITASAAEAFERSDQLGALASTCDGKGPRKVSLETWVLAGELDRVVFAASIHLERMTSGRYRLERTDAADHGNSQAGLNLLVLDAHTGIARRPSSLSGGEQFQASLALALGLADVVSQGGSASGRIFEALFVDEGFGSLDPESLAQAVDALHQIHATGRTVGVITHVEAMKEDLQLGIRVDRLPDGKGSTLSCHPEI
jgi:exonuclease SbcC